MSYDEQTRAVLERVVGRDSNCVDIGSHQGVILDMMLQLAPEAQHHAFEPLPDLFEFLARKYAGVPKTHIHNLALGEGAGLGSFQHVVTNPGYSGFRRRRYERPDELIVEIQVRIARLDDILPPPFPVRVIKIDVEGAELQVLRGSVELLRRCRPFVVFEHGRGAAEFYGTSPEMVFDFLASCDLQVSLIAEWLRAGGQTALSKADFCEEFHSARNYYFLAHP